MFTSNQKKTMAFTGIPFVGLSLVGMIWEAVSHQKVGLVPFILFAMGLILIASFIAWFGSAGVTCNPRLLTPLWLTMWVGIFSVSLGGVLCGAKVGSYWMGIIPAFPVAAIAIMDGLVVTVLDNQKKLKKD
ncbi:hypothetical protein EPN81_01110 [Patescibacteria group bacterium]|nr:MAG: hypothetical protein EPN81_01110 [Patescibacteria group bacterium]